MRPGDRRFVSTGSFDGVEVSAEILDLLWLFDGQRSAPAVLADMESKGVRLGQDLLIGLHQRRLLVSVEGLPGCTAASVR